MIGLEKEPLRGCIAPILTPYNDDLSVAHDLFTAHAQKMLDEGCVAIAPFGTTGEGASISRAERTNALWHLTQAGIPASKIIPGTGLTNLHATAALSRSCMDMGCAAVLTLPPYYYKKVPEDGLYAYFARMIEMVGDDLRMILYHIPHVAGVGIPVPLVQRLRRDFPDQVVGIKDSSGDLDNLKTLMRIEGLKVFAGSEALMPMAIPLGATGTITAVANLNAAAIADYVNAIVEKDDMRIEYLRDEIEAVREVVAARDYIMTPKRLIAMQTGDDRWANVRPPFIAAPGVAGQALKDALAAAR